MTKFPTYTFCLLLCCTLPAAQAAALDKLPPEIREFVEQMARDDGFDRAQLGATLAQAERKQSILDAISRPAERVVPWFEYRERFLNAKRIEQGAEFREAHAKRLASIEDPQLAAVVTGILGVETYFGRVTGRYRVLDALVTLAFDYPPRAEFFRGELKQFLLLTREEPVDPLKALGSYAGAMGSPQFIASSYRNFAVDADGDGYRDLWSNWDDVIGSVANYLRMHGWSEGTPIVVGAQIDAADIKHFDTANKLQLSETVQSLRDKGARFDTELAGTTPAMLIVAQGTKGPEYRVGFNNFFVITQYNRSVMYAMAVHDLGQAIRAEYQ